MYFVRMTFSASGKPIASVCHGQLILAAVDSIKGRKCTTYPPVKPILIAVGADWIEPSTMADTIVDGNLITLATYEGLPEFIRCFVKLLGCDIEGANKKILFLCGVSKELLLCSNNQDREKKIEKEVDTVVAQSKDSQ